jgi:hypothetical protein
MGAHKINRSFPLILFFIVLAACGRRGDPVAIEPYKEVGVVEDLKVSTREDAVYLTWGYPEEKTFPRKALKGFVIFRAEIFPGETPDNCECDFRSLDFIVAEKQKYFEYQDKKAKNTQSYVYKIVVMDKNNRMGKASDVVFLKGIQQETEEIKVSPVAPEGVIAVFTQKSIVITWDEVKERNVRYYRIYRSENGDFYPVGESVTPAFTDRTAMPSKKYSYRVTAVADEEGPPSQEIQIETKIFSP